MKVETHLQCLLMSVEFVVCLCKAIYENEDDKPNACDVAVVSTGMPTIITFRT